MTTSPKSESPTGWQETSSQPQITAEFGLVPIEDMLQGATAQYKGQKRTLQIRISDEAFINDQYGILRGYATQLKMVFDQAQEIAGAVYLNAPTSSATIALPTGQPLASTAQPLDIGTDSNTFTTQQTLSITALEDARSNLMLQKADKGYPAPKVGAMVLEVAPKNGLLAERLVEPNKNYPTTPNNDSNKFADQGVTVITSPYATNPEWWCLRMADNAQHKRFKLVRYGFKLMGDPFYDRNNDSWLQGAKENYLYGSMDYRGTFYSTPN